MSDNVEDGMERAWELLNSPTGRKVFWALDTLGWKVVEQDERTAAQVDQTNADYFPVWSTAKWPGWCDNPGERAAATAKVVSFPAVNGEH